MIEISQLIIYLLIFNKKMKKIQKNFVNYFKNYRLKKIIIFNLNNIQKFKKKIQINKISIKLIN